LLGFERNETLGGSSVAAGKYLLQKIFNHSLSESACFCLEWYSSFIFCHVTLLLQVLNDASCLSHTNILELGRQFCAA
jgi:hypothetical protein